MNKIWLKLNIKISKERLVRFTKCVSKGNVYTETAEEMVLSCMPEKLVFDNGVKFKRPSSVDLNNWIGCNKFDLLRTVLWSH